ncbi:hypothetical protein J421_0913 [Gemmatirosa kalamazoonensis]|uniref:Uncharacterized protein n=1 Tax=Gemmatirosa kalamazoonensis TaxID=861299 RepID=W0RDP6_9BACT|nr:hypothetical protein [Gemmatirosa kalamazoonensis]AHG88450.1 hypothetical protein J421_0913 [Gemmatirosa kalamazoonensis]
MTRRFALLAALTLGALPMRAQTTPPVRDRIADYTPVRLTTDLSKLTPSERRMLPLLIEAARARWTRGSGCRRMGTATRSWRR